MKLTVQIQDPELGKSWYKEYLSEVAVEGSTDTEIIALVKTLNPTATAVRITREYPLKPERAA